MTKTKIENLKLNSLPNLCGIYIFKLNNEILYIGKAKNIKKRVSQYFNGSINSYKTPLLISKVNNIDYIVCSNEKEALL
ncbi:MAG: GIY-YIG nuclease family protein, partial [Mycoplasmataceae bacterium]|nr:GIY-YIG nuclease family protein [Mycoplasmataceae bacterium]